MLKNKIFPDGELVDYGKRRATLLLSYFIWI
jgi:hypothetical protein